jgi:hypothetical protein
LTKIFFRLRSVATQKTKNQNPQKANRHSANLACHQHRRHTHMSLGRPTNIDDDIYKAIEFAMSSGPLCFKPKQAVTATRVIVPSPSPTRHTTVTFDSKPNVVLGDTVLGDVVLGDAVFGSEPAAEDSVAAGSDANVSVADADVSVADADVSVADADVSVADVSDDDTPATDTSAADVSTTDVSAADVSAADVSATDVSATATPNRMIQNMRLRFQLLYPDIDIPNDIVKLTMMVYNKQSANSTPIPVRDKRNMCWLSPAISKFAIESPSKKNLPATTDDNISRPPRPVAEQTTQLAESRPRPRGRPPAEDVSSSPARSATPRSRPRGRPPKNPKPPAECMSSPAAECMSSPAAENVSPPHRSRPRGRPPKNPKPPAEYMSSPAAEYMSSPAVEDVSSPHRSRPRGRPPKNPKPPAECMSSPPAENVSLPAENVSLAAEDVSSPAEDVSPPPRSPPPRSRPRGRPPKNSKPPAVEDASSPTEDASAVQKLLVDASILVEVPDHCRIVKGGKL